MEEPVVANIVCPACDTPYVAAVCPHCGTPAAQIQVEVPTAKMRLEENPKLIICVMVFAALFLGFPLLWHTRHMSRSAKIFWAIFVTVESILIFWLFCWLIWNYSIVPIREALKG